jgi:hypothetical protein
MHHGLNEHASETARANAKAKEWKEGTPFVLNEHADPCGGVGVAADCYCLGNYRPDVEYVLDVASTDVPNEKGERGAVRLPVGSIGMAGGRFYFAADSRFVHYPGFDCVFPSRLELKLVVLSVGGGWRGSLQLAGAPVIDCKTRIERHEVIEYLTAWAGRQPPGKFALPDEIVDAMKAVVETEATQRGVRPALSPGDVAMNAAFDTESK